MRTFKRILGVLLIFFFGVFVGVVVTGAGTWQRFHKALLGGPEAVVDAVVWRLDHELRLDGEQKRKLQGIVDDARIQLRQSRAKIQPEVDETLREAAERTRAILYPEQVKKFDAMVGKSREKWKIGAIATTPEPATPAPATAPPVSEPSATPPPNPSATPPRPATVDGK